MSERGPIVCATDLGATGALAVDLAARMANATALPLQLVHVTAHGPDLASEDSLTEAERVLRERLITRIEAAASALEKERLRAEGLGPHVEAELLEGRPWEEIIECATRHQASLVVVGPHGLAGTRAATRGGLTEHILGTTADRVVRHAPCPVLVGARDGGPPVQLSRGTWLVGVDFSKSSRAALRIARDLAHHCDAHLVPIHIVHEPVDDAPKDDPLHLEQARHLPEAKLRREELRTLVREELGRDVDVEIALGDPADALAIAGDVHTASLLIIGTRGRTGLAHLLLGSTAERALRRSPVPVLCVRPQPEMDV